MKGHTFKKRKGKSFTNREYEEVEEVISQGPSGSEYDEQDSDDDETSFEQTTEELLPQVNQKTHMVYKEINKIENMEKFVSLKSLWIRFRNIKKIQNLEN